ncbi:hypothetical protein AERO8C_120308 [Aeromonas veronii]|uniref:Uncharacterized protein n=1 Tax=Aeromonas veronii TaxID=654 RepID=A0A653KTU2_AERVE|nr:hypothetical protein AERO8C_120308 [Aeromonas veronii]
MVINIPIYNVDLICLILGSYGTLAKKEIVEDSIQDVLFIAT